MESLVHANVSGGDLAPLSDSVFSASEPYVGQWSRLVSTTNWEKGRIIVAWREALVAEELPVADYSDDAWSRLVGGVSGQHVGRLRRVFQRFGPVRDEYPGLYWSHFQAALDWNDAEMWLEGARQSNWSVSQMRQRRAETLGTLEPASNTTDTDRDDEDSADSHVSGPAPITGEYAEFSSPRYDGPDFGDEPAADYAKSADESSDRVEAGYDEEAPAVRPFEDLPELPDDLADAMESIKLAILRHKTAGWELVSERGVLQMLDALKALVTAPSLAT